MAKEGDVVQLPVGNTLTVQAAADAFLDALPNPNTVRAYALGKTATRLGEAQPLAAVANDEIGETLEALWGSAAVRRAARPRLRHRLPGHRHPARLHAPAYGRVRHELFEVATEFSLRVAAMHLDAGNTRTSRALLGNRICDRA